MAITNQKFDNRLLGIIVGTLLPVMVFFSQLSIKNYPLSFVADAFKDNKPFIAGLFTICLIVNGIVFGILVQFKKQLTAIGLFIPTAVIGIAVLIYKYF
jgi:FtsH-binding integral membrane protein